MEKKEMKTGRGSVFYWIEKNAAPGAKCIVFTHGLTANHSMFEKQVEYLGCPAAWHFPAIPGFFLWALCAGSE